MDVEQKLFNVVEVGRILGLKPSTVYHMVRSGRIPAVRIGECVRISERTLQAIVDSAEALNGEQAEQAA